MAVITPNTFDPTNRFSAVRFAQGTPLCDCDLNEEIDIRRDETRFIVRDIVGNGAPGQSGGFAISGTSANSDFDILVGPPGPEAGVMMVGGYVVRLTSDTTLRGQPLHESQAGASTLATRLQTATIPEIPTPGADGSITIYLDVWERLLEAAEDPSLILPALGVETSARMIREFTVRWRDGLSVPTSGDSDFETGHLYLALAQIARRLGDDQIAPSDITDLRRIGVSTPTRGDFSQIATDAFGTSYAIDGAGPRLGFSLRDVINAILRDGRAAIIGPDTLNNLTPNFPQVVYGQDGLRQLYWMADSGPGARGLFRQQELSGGDFGTAVSQFDFTGGLSNGSLNVLRQPDGVIWIIYRGTDAGDDEIYARRFAGNVFAPEITISTGSDNSDPVATLDDAGNIHIVWRDTSGPTNLQSARIALGAASATAPVSAGDTPGAGLEFAVAGDPEGGVRLVKAQNPPNWALETKRWDPGTSAWEAGFTSVTNTISANSLALTAALTPTGEVALAFTVTDAGTTFDLEIARLEVSPGGYNLADRRRLVRATVATQSEIPLQPSLTGDPSTNLCLTYRTQVDFRVFTLIYEI